MRIPFLLIIIAFSTSLHGMETDLVLYKKLKNKSLADLKLYCHLSNNIDNIIDVAESSNDGHLLASLMHVLLPQDVIKKHIAPYLSEPVATEYKDKLIGCKSIYDEFKVDKIDNKDQWIEIMNHDGTYHVVPKIEGGYLTWNANNTIRRTHTTYENKKYIHQLKSNRKGDLLSLASLDTSNQAEQDKNLIFIGNNEAKFITDGKTTPYFFSNDGTLLAICCSQGQNNTLEIRNTKTFDGMGTNLKGSISALCSAHHSPAFVAGSNQAYTDDLPNLVCYFGKTYTKLSGHRGPITSIDLSLDDTKLLTCWRNGGRSDLILWDTSNFDSIKKIDQTSYPTPLQKAFFTCNGERIVMVDVKGCCQIMDVLDIQHSYTLFMPGDDTKSIPIFIWSNNSKLLIHTRENKIKIVGPSNSGYVSYGMPITGIGLTVDEKNIIFIDEKDNVCQLPLYDDQDCNEIDFIEKHASIVQLYDMFTMYKPNKKGYVAEFVEKIKSYIQDFTCAHNGVSLSIPDLDK